MVPKKSPRPGLPDLSVDDIRRIREGLGLTQVQAGELIGGGPRAFAKYESGVIKPAASVANLLRLLEKAPHELKTLAGTKAVPVDAATHRPLEVSADHVRALTPKKFTLLLERLLSAEAFSGHLPMDGIHVAAQITVGDGGEDARMEWRDGPERTAFLPSRVTQFQLKATAVTPAKAGRDVLTPKGKIQPMVKAVLETGGSYVMLVAHPAVKQSMAKHEAAIRETLKAKHLRFADAQIAVRDAAQIALWVNARPSVAAWLLEQTQPGLTGPFRDWAHWTGRHEHDSSPWVDDPRLEPFRAELRSLIGLPRGIARVVGPSGVGKSRLTLEALGPDAAEETSRLTLSSLVLYAVESEAGSTAVKAAVQSLADAGDRAIVVVDRCDFETHEDLAGMARRLGSQLSLVTIDHEYDAHHTPPPGTLIIKKADKAVVEGIVHNVLPGLGKGEEERLAHFAGGFPQAARLIAESWEEGSFVAASNDALIDRVLVGRRAAEKHQLRKAGMLLSVFGLVGLKPPLDADIGLLAVLPGATAAEELRDSFEDLLRRGVAQARGRLISLQPPPITQPLAERQWRQWNRKTWDHVLTGLPNVELRIRAAQQLALLNREDIALDVVRAVCRVSGPLASVEKLSGEGGAEVLSFLAEVDAKAVADLLEHVLGPLDLDRLREIKGDTRRNLVRALAKIAFRDDTFEQGARILLSFAGAENEDWSDNATGEFKNLFSLLGGSTAAGPAARLQMLDDMLSEGDKRLLPLVVDALLQGADTHGGFRAVGAEFHGSRPALKPWMPTNWKDAWDYVRECLTRLAHLAARNDAVGARAKAGLGHDFRALVGYGLLDDVERVFAIAMQSGSYWPEALGSLGDILVYDADALKDDEEKRVRALIARLTPTDMASRVRFLVTEMPWNYPVDEKLELDERRRRQLADVEALAVELLASPPEDLQRVLPDLSRGDQRMSTAFGRAIAQRASDPLAWMDPITAAYAGAPEGERNFGLLGGFLGGLAARHPEAVATFKQEAVTSATFAPTLPFVCTCVGLAVSDIPIAVEAMNAGFLPPALLRSWTFGGKLALLPTNVLAPLFDSVFAAGGDACSIALNLLGMYVHRDHERLDGLRPQLRTAAANAGRGPKHQMDMHHFKEVMEWILNKGRGDPDAAAIALSLAKQVVATGEERNGKLIKPLLPQLLRDFPEIVWPILGEAIIRDRKNAWFMELSLSDSFTFHVKMPAILELPEEVLFAWCHAHPEAAPAYATGLLPVLTSRNPDDVARALHPKMKRLLDEFGNRDDVLKALTRNMYTFGWSGSLADYYALYDGPLQALEMHQHGAVRRWAKQTRSQLSAQIDNVRTEEDELDANRGN
jgi:hypothetical protein